MSQFDLLFTAKKPKTPKKTKTKTNKKTKTKKKKKQKKKKKKKKNKNKISYLKCISRYYSVLCKAKGLASEAK